MPETTDKPPLYAQFDGDEYAGRTYSLGEQIDVDAIDFGTRTMLEANGRIGASIPAALAVDTSRDVKSMSRAQLLTEIAHGRTDEELREAVLNRREMEAAQVDPDEDGGDPRLALSIPKFKTEIADESNLDTLRALRAEEGKREKPRAGITDAIDARIAEVEAEGKPDYERDNLKDLPLADADRDRLLVIAAYEGADVPDPDKADDAALRTAIETKRAG